MQYILTPIQRHKDNGFGITADAYYHSAEHLRLNHFEHYDIIQQAEMPQNFLYRHSIELYLKSLIIIFHKTLKINYGTVHYNSDDPELLVNGQWRKLYISHYIDSLYNYWINNLLIPNQARLEKEYPIGDWVEYKNMSSLIPIICKYDQDSSYFRYPITKNVALDDKKYSMQKFKAPNLAEFMKNPPKSKGGFTTLFVEGDDILEAFSKETNVLSDVRDALRELANYFYCVHIMTRHTLCGGM